MEERVHNQPDDNDAQLSLADKDYGGALNTSRTEVKFVPAKLQGEVGKEGLKWDYDGPHHAVTLLLGMVGVIAGSIGWSTAGWLCGVVTMAASLGLVIVYLLLA